MNTVPPKKRPRDRRNTREPCVIVPMFNITHLSDLINPENVAGIYIFNDKNDELKQKLKHVTDVFNIILKTLHAWHNSHFCSNLHSQLKSALLEFQNNVSNLDYSSFDKKMTAMQSILVHLKKTESSLPSFSKRPSFFEQGFLYILHYTKVNIYYFLILALLAKFVW